MSIEHFDRRSFLGASAAGLGYFFTASAPSALRAGDGPNGKIHIAGIGVGGKGHGDIEQAGSFGEVVAICDVDETKEHLGWAKEKWTGAKTYFDFRKMYDEMGKDIDAVTVSTPDHCHALASILAIKQKKHVYCQKPLTHSVFEARQMRLLAKKYGVCTQMGNQGTAANGLRRAVELIQSGTIGQVKEVHVWTNRPIWPQAPEVMSRPASKPTPSTLHWDEFLGPSQQRPFADGYHPFKWRGWWDFGTGALGDMACHTANMAFMALKLGSPTSIVSQATDVNPETCPSSAHIVFEFPARGDMAPVTFHWYEGKKDGKKLLPPSDLIEKVLAIEAIKKKGKGLVNSGSIMVGEKGILYSPDDYGAEIHFTPEKEFAGLNVKTPETLAKNNGGDSGQKKEWIEAIKAGKPTLAFSNFDYAGMLTETILLGNVASRTGKKLLWDAEKMECTGCPEASQFIKLQARKGWEIDPYI